MKKTKIFFIAMIALVSINANATETVAKESEITEEKPSWFKYLPTVKGTFRAKYEWSPELGASRFQLRNARIGLLGDILDNLSYKVEMDFCDAGTIRLADAYTKLSLVEKQFGITAGFMRLPISLDGNKGPSNQYFANRSFLGKYVGNVRDVGVKFGYYPSKVPFTAEVGIYNGKENEYTSNQWNKTLSYVGRINYIFNGLKIEASALSQRPGNIRMNSFDVALSWNYNHIFLEAEYMNKHYTGSKFKTVHAYNIMGHYRIPFKKVLTHMLIQARWDSMTDYSNGLVVNNQGMLECTNPGRNRITAGVTFAYLKKIGAEFRINYEKYFYHDKNAIVNENEQDKLVAEFVVKF